MRLMTMSIDSIELTKIKRIYHFYNHYLTNQYYPLYESQSCASSTSIHKMYTEHKNYKL